MGLDSREFELPSFIVARRCELRLSVTRLSEHLGVSEDVLRDWETGGTPVPLLKLSKLARALQVNADLLILRVLQKQMPHIWDVFEEKIRKLATAPDRPPDKRNIPATQKSLRYDSDGKETPSY